MGRLPRFEPWIPCSKPTTIPLRYESEFGKVPYTILFITLSFYEIRRLVASLSLRPLTSSSSISISPPHLYLSAPSSSSPAPSSHSPATSPPATPRLPPRSGDARRMPSWKRRAMVELQLREEKTSRWLPGKKPGAGKKPAVGKKPGAGKTGASSSTPKKRAAPPRLQGGNVAGRPAAIPPPPQQARCLCTRWGRRRLQRRRWPRRPWLQRRLSSSTICLIFSEFLYLVCIASC